MIFSLDLISFDAFVTKDLAQRFEITEYCKEAQLSHIPPIERRRLDQGARGVFTLLTNCNCPIVFSSFNGEINRSFKMYETLKQDGVITPTTFSLSVLNAIPALCSIMFKNTQEILAISENMSVEYGLLNAYLLLQEEASKECLVIAYREVENFYSPNGVIVLVFRVKKGSSLQLKQSFCQEKDRENMWSEITFLKNYNKNHSWISISQDEQWEWNVLS